MHCALKLKVIKIGVVVFSYPYIPDFSVWLIVEAVLKTLPLAPNYLISDRFQNMSKPDRILAFFLHNLMESCMHHDVVV